MRPCGLMGFLLAGLLLVGGCGAVGGSSPAADTDGDGLSDARERKLGTDPENPDSDGDGATDGSEMEAGTSPLDPDSDHDGILDGVDPVIDPPRPRDPSLSSGNDVEPNDSFDEPVRLVIAGAGTLTLEGQIDRMADVDVFDLGSFDPGDSIRVDFERVDSGFSPSAAIFDENGVLFYVSADRSGPGGPDLNGFLAETIRHASERYFFAVAPRQGDPTIGSYRFDVRIERGGAVPPPVPQTIYFDFDGGAPDRALLGISEVDPFDAAAIDPRLAGQDELIKEAIIETFLLNLADYDIEIITSDDNPVAPDDATTILFGSEHENAFGVSVGVDEYNQDPCDDGIIFTESFSPTVFETPLVLGAEEIGVAIGNVAAHEVGHLLGLNHVTNVTALMDEASPAIHLLSDQAFKLAPLSLSVFPIGEQDASVLLAEILGPS